MRDVAFRDAASTALCHEWTTAYGGSEQVASRLANLLDVRDVYTFAADPGLADSLFPDRAVHAHRLGLTELARRHWRWLLPFMAGGWSRLDLSEYDLVVTSSHSCVNSVRVRPGAMHVSYCHTPMRYAWEWRTEIGRMPAPLRPVWPAIAAMLRKADLERARNVTAFIANSHHVAKRIRECYGRAAAVVHPPIDVDFWTPGPSRRRENFFLFAGRLVPYKRPDLAVEAARAAGAELVVAGSGSELPRLRRMAGQGVRFVVAPDRAALRELYRSCRGFLNPGIEDFGMTMAEAQACGAPVIAAASGGAEDIVIPGRTGILYPESSALSEVLESFTPGDFRTDDARANAQRFAPERFDEGIVAVIETAASGGEVAA